MGLQLVQPEGQLPVLERQPAELRQVVQQPAASEVPLQQASHLPQ